MNDLDRIRDAFTKGRRRVNPTTPEPIDLGAHEGSRSTHTELTVGDLTRERGLSLDEIVTKLRRLDTLEREIQAILAKFDDGAEPKELIYELQGWRNWFNIAGAVAAPKI